MDLNPSYKFPIFFHKYFFEHHQHPVINVFFGVFEKKVPRSVKTIILSPGFPQNHQIIKDAKIKNIEIIGDIEFASRFIKNEKIIAITGTNGKSTTVSLIAKILKNDGKKVFLCGNIGNPVIDGLEQDYDFFVVELSSFQLETMKNFRPDVAAILNVSPDHLDRYESYEEYLLTKAKLSKLLKNKGILVLNGGEESLIATTLGFEGEKRFFSVDEKSDVDFSNGFIISSKVKIDFSKTKLVGNHNVENIMASILCCEDFIDNISSIKKAVYEFKSLNHRTEFVDNIENVRFYNDSKGTNVGAVEKSLSGFQDKSVVLILGGVDKGGSYEPLRILADKKCCGIVLIGQSTQIIKSYFEDFYPLKIATTMQDAVEKSFEIAKNENGEIVLLSPACSSYDMYPNYKKRGEDFVNCVKKLKIKEKN